MKWSHTMTKQLITKKQAKLATRNKRAKVKRHLILLGPEVGLTKISKEWWSSSGPKERLNCLDYYSDEIEKYYLCFWCKFGY